jgi:hypothetical protein
VTESDIRKVSARIFPPEILNGLLPFTSGCIMQFIKVNIYDADFLLSSLTEQARQRLQVLLVMVIRTL